MAKTNVLVCAPTFPPAYRSGGPARTLEALVREAPPQFQVWVVAPNRDLGIRQPLNVPAWRWVKSNESCVQYVDERRLGKLIRLFSRSAHFQPEIIYLNSFFNPLFSLLPLFLAELGFWKSALLVLAPRGEMNELALSSHRPQKKVIIATIKMMKIMNRVVWHASSEREAEQIRAVWGSQIEIIIREDEVSLPKTAESPQLSSEALRLGFVGRIVPNKGLLEAIRAVTSLRCEVDFIIYGPSEDEKYLKKCREAAESAPPSCRIVFAGAVAHDEVREVFKQFDAFVFPTHFESFGHVIAESLSMSCPVFVPDTTPWTAVISEGGGFIIESEQDSLGKLLHEFSTLSPEDRLKFRDLAGSAYNRWNAGRDAKHVFQIANELRR